MALGLADTSASDYSNGGPPSGCFYSDVAYMPYLGNLVLNGDDRFMNPCSVENRCICRTVGSNGGSAGNSDFCQDDMWYNC